MTKAKVALWVIGLLLGTLIWALLLDTAMFGGSIGNFTFRMGVALGMGGPVFVITGAIAGIVYVFKRKPATAMWTWTILLLVTFVALGLGAVKQVAS